jgi:hypothetical protein
MVLQVKGAVEKIIPVECKKKTTGQSLISTALWQEVEDFQKASLPFEVCRMVCFKLVGIG